MKKLLSTTLAVGLFTSMTIAPVLADVSATTLPALKSSDNAVVTTQNAKMNIKVGGDKQGAVGTLNWNKFNVGKDAHVNYEFTAHNQTAFNKVDAAGGMSQIYGKITNTGCNGCGYAGTGKVILLNPNGVLFGDGANVDLNSFTVSTMDGKLNNANQLELVKGANQTKDGIIVENGAKIYGDTNVAFASNNIAIYNGSQISTNIGNNSGDIALGKVKLVTSDGVTFNYYPNGAIDNITGIVGSTDKMMININGDIKSGQIDIRNYSNNADSEINLKGATLKATKAIEGNDGNIWLTASNKIVSEDTSYTTENMKGAENRKGGEVVFLAGQKVSSKNDTINAVGDVKMTSKAGDVAVKGAKITTPKDVIIVAGGDAGIQQRSVVSAKNISVTGNNVYLTDSNITASEKIVADAVKGDVGLDNANLKAKEIDLTASNDVYGNANVNNNLTKIKAGNDIDVELLNVGNRDKGLIAEADKNVTITTPGTLSVSSIISKNGDVTLNADKVIAGLPYTDNEKIPGDNSPRSYIYVKNGTFTSNTTNDSFEVTASDTVTADGKHKERHHIQYGNGDEKILLINDRPFDEPPTPPEPVPPEPVPPEPVPPVPPTPDPDIDDGQASMLNKIPRQPEIFNNNTIVNDGRTTFVDVFAAASQIEIEEDEEE